MKKVIAVALLALGGGVAFYLKGSNEATINHLMFKYPDCDRKIAKKVYRRIFLNVVTGTLGVDVDELDENEMDELFLARYNEYVRSN